MEVAPIFAFGLVGKPSEVTKLCYWAGRAGSSPCGEGLAELAAVAVAAAIAAAAADSSPLWGFGVIAIAAAFV